MWLNALVYAASDCSRNVIFNRFVSLNFFFMKACCLRDILKGIYNIIYSTVFLNFDFDNIAISVSIMSAFRESVKTQSSTPMHLWCSWYTVQSFTTIQHRSWQTCLLILLLTCAQISLGLFSKFNSRCFKCTTW